MNIGSRWIFDRIEEVRNLRKLYAVLLFHKVSHALQHLADRWQRVQHHMVGLPAGLVDSNQAERVHD